MNVILFHQYAYIADGVASTRHYEFATRMARGGATVSIVAGGFDHKRKVETKTYPPSGWVVERIDGVSFAWIRTTPYHGSGLRRLWGMFEYAFRAFRFAWKHCHDAQVAIGSSPSLLAGVAAAAFARLRGIPFVLEVRDLWPLTFSSLGHMPKWHPLYLVFALIERLLYRRADLVITTLPNAKPHIESVAGKSVPVLCIPNGANFAASIVENEQECRRQLLPMRLRKTFNVVYAGAIGVSNDVNVLIQAARSWQGKHDVMGREIQLLLFGDGELRKPLEKGVAEEGLTNVHFLGQFQKKDVARHLACADCFVAAVRRASVYEYGISLNKLNDYLAAARPIVLASNAPFDPVSQTGAGFVVPPGDPGRVADAVARIAAMPPEERRKLGEMGRMHGRNTLDFSVLAAQFESALGRVTRGHSCE